MSCSAGSSSRSDPSSAMRKPKRIVPTRSPFARLWLIASLVRSPIASRSPWETAVMMLSTSLPARPSAGVQKVQPRSPGRRRGG